MLLTLLSRSRMHVTSVVIAVVMILTALSVPARADNEPGQLPNPLIIHSLSIVGDEARARIIMHMDRETKPDWFLLRGPERLVIDFPKARFRFADDAAVGRGIVKGIRYGALDETRARVILPIEEAFAVERIETVSDTAGGGFRLIVDLVSASRAAFEEALARQAKRDERVRATKKSDRAGQIERKRSDKFTIAIDPGHGGIDGGAEGPGGTMEKTITLAFGLELRAKLEKTGLFRVVMTRDSDVFLRLDERVRIGRQNNADLLISIHADSINARRVRGATVYTISEKASDSIARHLAERENLADTIAGIELEEEDEEVADILVDLMRRETQTFSVRFARSLVGELSKNVDMIKNPHRSAGFQVLTAPDVPSVLVELGYLSNPKDETLLRDVTWRKSAVDSIASAIALFAAARQDAGG